MSRNRKFHRRSVIPDRCRSWLTATSADTAVQSLDLVAGRAAVRRPVSAARLTPPPWMIQGVLTTAVIATIGFTVQHFFISSPGNLVGSTAIDRWRSTDSRAVDAASLPTASSSVVVNPDQQALQPISRDAAIALNDSVPFSTTPIRGAVPFNLASATREDRDRATGCLAQAIYYEAGGDTIDDQRAVAQVVLNRERHPLFPKTVCGVVFQGSQLKTGCQFTFTCDGSMGRTPDPRAWARAQVMAAEALNGAVFAPVGYATHFHTPWVAPYWSPTMLKIAKVGGHLFYRWPGGLGSPGAFIATYAGGEMANPGGHVAPPLRPGASAASRQALGTTVELRKIAVASVETPLTAPPVVDVGTQLVAAPLSIVLAAGPRTARTYHPPIPRGGSAQPLLTRDW